MCQARQASWSLQMLFLLPGTPFFCSSAWQRPTYVSCGLWKATSSGRSPLALRGRFRHPFSREPSVFCPCFLCSIYHTVRSLQVCLLVRLWDSSSFYWSIIDLQCCLSFWCTAKWFSYTSIYLFFIIFFPIVVYYRILNTFPVLYSRTLLFMCFKYSSFYLLVLNS